MKTDTHRALIDAALKVLLERGFARATTKEIAQTAGLAEGTIYRHFADKHALFHEVFLSLTENMAQELQRFPERAGRFTVRDNLQYLFELVGGMQEHLSTLMASMWADPDVAKSFREYAQEHAPPGFEAGPESMVAYIRAEQELGRIRSDVDAVEAAAVVISVPFARSMEHALNALFLAPAHFPEPGTGALDVLARGLSPCPRPAPLV